VQRDLRPVPNPDAVLREEFDDWAILFNPDTAAAVGVSPVGVATWKLIDGQRSLEEIAAALRRSFEEVPETVMDDIGVFVAELVEYGFVGRAVPGSDDGQ
jgi:SynChlorMet cassette protein ScmD